MSGTPPGRGCPADRAAQKAMSSSAPTPAATAVSCSSVVLALGAVEELDVVGDDLELWRRPFSAVPLGVVQAALDGDLAALGEVLAAVVGLASEDGHVDVVGALVLAVLAAGRWTAMRSLPTACFRRRWCAPGSWVSRPMRLTIDAAM